MAYELVLPSDAWIHSVFHITKLKPYHGYLPAQIPPLFSSADEDQSLTPTVLGNRVGVYCAPSKEDDISC